MTSAPYRVSAALLARDDFKQACAARDFQTMFKLMQKWDGASQGRIAAPVEGLYQGRVNAVINGGNKIKMLHLIEAICDGLRIPGSYLGLAARPWETEPDATRGTATTTALAEAPAPAAEAVPAAGPAGEMVERLSMEIDIAADGAARLDYQHEIRNDTPAPITRFVRELWFAVSDGKLAVEPVQAGEHNLLIQRMHETPSHLAYACQLFPAVQPGESATVAYTCTGGVFGDEHYWRQAIVNPVSEYTIRVRLRGVETLTQCTAVEERPDGSEISAAETLLWHRDGGDVVIELTRKELRPNQFVTVRWDFPRAVA